MADDKQTGVSPLSILSLVLGFVTAPGVFCCFGYGTGIVGVILGIIGWMRLSSSSANRVVAGFGLGVNGLAMVAYGISFMFVAASNSDAVDPEAGAKREQEREERRRTAEEESARKKMEAEATEKAKWDALPASERDFCAAIDAAADAYRAADNDLKKSKVRRERAAAIKAAVPKGVVSKWSGKVKTLTTTGQGNVVLVITLPCEDFTVGTWNNEFSDVLDNTLISSASSVYDTLAEMGVGEGITFGGRFVLDDLNGFKGTSMTELGSMTDEAFLLQF